MTDMTERHLWKGEGAVRKLLVPQTKAIDEAARTIEFVVSTGAKDRDGDEVDPAGWDVSGFMKNPVVLWAHDSRQPPVARAERIWVEGGALKAMARFTDADTYAFGDTVFKLYAGGFLSAVSAGFMPKEMEPILNADSGWIDGFKITSQELWEFSAVPIPSNPEALVSARSAGIDVKRCEGWIEQALDEGAVAGETRDLLSKAFVHLKGRVHPAIQADLAKRNAEAAAKRGAGSGADHLAPDKLAAGGIVKGGGKMVGEDGPEAVVPLTREPDGRLSAKAAPGTMLNTGAAEDGHTHEFEMGAAQTEPAGEDEHVHALTYAEDGAVTVEPAEQHEHEVAEALEIEDEEEKGDGEDEPEPEAEKAADLAAQIKIAMDAAREAWPGEALTIEVKADGTLSVAPVAAPKAATPPASVEPPAPKAQAHDPNEIDRLVKAAIGKMVGEAFGKAFAQARGRVTISG